MTKISIYISGMCLAVSMLLCNASLAQEITPPEHAPAEQPSNQKQTLKTTVDNYMKAWQAQDFTTMRSYESWEGGSELGEVQYIQSFKADFKLYHWKIIKMIPTDNDRYKVMILMGYSPPKQVPVPSGTTVQSTRNQWWKKQGDKFVHLFHIERKMFMEILFPSHPPPVPK